MRILVFLHSFDAGGVERVALRLCGAWAQAGHEVRIAMGRPGGPLEHEAPAGVPIDLAPPFALARHCESLWLVPHLVAQVRRHRPDVLFCAGNTYAVVAVLARLLLGEACPPIVCKISNSLDRRDYPAPLRWLYRRWLRLQTVFIDSFVGLAEGLRPEISATLKISRERIAIVEDPALRLAQIAGPPQSSRQGGPRRLVAVGRLAPQKDFGLLIRTFARLSESHHLTILGEGPERRRLEALARRLGVAGRIDLPSHAADIEPWLAHADVLVLSSRYEGVPAVVIEALANGLPVVATNCSAAMADLVGPFGALTPVGDVKALASAIERVGSRTFDAAAMRAHIAAFTVERAAPRYLSVMAGAIGSAHGPEAVAKAQP